MLRTFSWTKILHVDISKLFPTPILPWKEIWICDHTNLWHPDTFLKKRVREREREKIVLLATPKSICDTKEQQPDWLVTNINANCLKVVEHFQSTRSSLTGQLVYWSDSTSYGSGFTSKKLNEFSDNSVGCIVQNISNYCFIEIL